MTRASYQSLYAGAPMAMQCVGVLSNGRKRFFRSICLSFLLAAALVSALSPSNAFCADSGEGGAESAARLLDSAKAALAEGKDDAALTSLLRLLESSPDNQEALRAAGDVLVKQGEYDRALSMYTRLLRLRPDDGSLMVRVGLLRQRLGQVYEAEAALFRATKSGRLSNEDAALGQKALDTLYGNWSILDAMRARDDKQAEERFHTYHINKAPDGAAASYALRGFARHAMHKPKEALEDFNKALAMGGIDENLRNAVLQSKSEMEQGRETELLWIEIRKTVSELEAKKDYKGLEAYYTSLLDKETARVYAAVSRAFLRVSRGEYVSAESDLRFALQANPDAKAKEDIEKGLRLIAELRSAPDREAARRLAESAAKEQAAESAAETERLAEKAAEERPAPQPYIDPYPLFDETEKLLRQNKLRQAETVLAKLRRLPLEREEKGIFLYFLAESAWAKGEKDKAYQGYARASRMVGEKYRKSSILGRMAEYHAQRGDREEAAAYAARSAALLPREAWKMVQTAGLFNSIGMGDEAVAYYKAALALGPEPRTAANAASGMAESRKAQKDQPNYLRHAREYVDIVKAAESGFSDEEKGLAAFYQAELYEAANEPARAFQSYETASRLLKEKHRLSETYVKMARYQAEQGDSALAASYAESSVALLPDQIWRIQDAIGIFRQTDNLPKAEEYAKQAVFLDPMQNGGLYQELADMYLNKGDRENFLANNALYIDYLLERMEKSGVKPSREDQLKLYEARKRQKELSRTWGFASYQYYSRTNEGNYYYGMTNELYREFRLANGRYGKFYAQYVGTLTSYFSGDYLNRTTMKRSSWVSRQHWNDTAHGVLGVQIHPFSSLYDLSFDAEYVFPLHDGKDKDDDFRIRVSYGWTKGDEPMPFGNMWDYLKLHTSATYSFRDGDVTSSYSFNGGDVTAGSEFRYGKTFVMDFDRNFLTIPFVQAKVSYHGQKREPGERWQLEVGPSLIFKKWFNEDKLHTPKSSVEVQFYYNWGLNGRHENTFGVNAAISF